MEKINDILKTFSPITLSEMDEKKLMNRTDTKYVFSISELPVFLEALKDDYRVLDVNGLRISRYETLYFDTAGLELFHKHRRGSSNRHKIRMRRYVESDLNFFEIKFKNNKGRTIKDRIRQKQMAESISNEAEAFLHDRTPLLSSDLTPQFWIYYSRITLVNKYLSERVTIDLNLHFTKGTEHYDMKDLVIAEVKQEKLASSAFFKLMKKHHIRIGSVSKYCLGVIQLNNSIAHNNFKPNLRNINKVIYGTSSGR